MPNIQVDRWSGEVHEHHEERQKFDNWDDAQAFIRKSVEQGDLCNILHEPEVYLPDRTN